MTMGNIDLNLVPFESLLKELESRCDIFICAFCIIGPEKDVIECRSGKGRWDQATALSNILNNHILNNWNNEQTILQKIIEKEDLDL